MPAIDLLTPPKKPWSTWTLLFGLTLLLAVGIWQVNQDRYLPRDSVELSYLDNFLSFYSIYYVGQAIIMLCRAAVSSFIKKYGLKPSLLYISCITVLSCVLVCLLDVATLQTASVAQHTIVRRLEDSVVVIEEKRGPIIHKYMTGVVPYSIEEHTKYEGEDAVFECYRLLSFTEDAYPISDQVVWEKDSKVVLPSDHINITWKFENVSKTTGNKEEWKHYMVSSKLTVTFLDNYDFGNYSCLVKNLALTKRKIIVPPPKPVPPMCPLIPPECMCICVCEPPPLPQPRLEITMDKSRWRYYFDKVKVFSLIRMQNHTRLVHAPPGGLVSFSATYDHLGEREDILFDYTIGGKPHDSVCGRFTTGCSVSVLLYWYFFHNGGHSLTFYESVEHVRMKTAITGTGWQCVCKNAYNYHEFSFSRRIYNRTSGREEIREVKYPHTVKLASRTPDLIFYNFNNKVDPLAREPCWVDSHEETMTLSCKQDEQLVEWTMWIFLSTESIVVTFMVIESLVLVVFFSRQMSKLIVIPLRNRILEGKFKLCGDCPRKGMTLGCINEDENTAIKQSVYISHSKSSKHAASQLKKILKSFDVTSFLPHEDILIGQVRTIAIPDAIASSRRFIVILTQEYIDSGMQNRYEFQFILKKVLKKTADNRNLLILIKDESKVPDTLKQFCILDWTTNTELDKKRRCLKKWSEGNVQGGIICAC